MPPFFLAILGDTMKNNYFAIAAFNIPYIPEVRNVTSAQEYEIFGMIFDLFSKGKDCFFSNEYISKLVNKTKSSVAKILTSLERKHLIIRKYNERNKNNEKRYITPNMDFIMKLISDRINKQNIHLENSPDNIKTNNRKSNQHQGISPDKKAPVLENIQSPVLEKNNKVTYNIKSIYREDNSKYKLDLKENVKNYFEEISSDFEIDSSIIAEKFINKHLSGVSLKNNIGNWRGLARNFWLNWQKFEKPNKKKIIAPIDQALENKKRKIKSLAGKTLLYNREKYVVDGDFLRKVKNNALAPITVVIKHAEKTGGKFKVLN